MTYLIHKYARGNSHYVIFQMNTTGIINCSWMLISMISNGVNITPAFLVLCSGYVRTLMSTS